MEFRTLLDLVQRWWLTLVIAALIGGIAGYAAADQVPERYESQARLLVGPVSAEIDIIRAASSLTETYAALATSEQLLGGVVEELALSGTTAELRDAIQIRTDQTARILSVSAEAREPAVAADIANAMVEALQRYDEPALGPVGQLTVVDVAPVPVEPSGPGLLLLTALAMATSVATAGLVIIAMEYGGGRVRGPSDLQQVAAPYLGYVVPRLQRESARGRRVLTVGAVLSRIRARPESIVKVLLVPTIEADDSSAALAVDMAIEGASSGLHVALVDGDDIEPRVSTLYALADRTAYHVDAAGAVEKAVGRWPDVIRPNEITPGGMVEPAWVEEVRDEYDLVVVHCAPLHATRNGNLLAAHADAALITAAVGKTHRASLEYTVTTVRQLGTSIAGSVLTGSVSETRPAPGSAGRRGFFRRITREGWSNPVDAE